MLAFTLRRAIQAIGVLIAVGIISFSMFRFAGDPVNQILGCRDDPKVNRGEANLGGYCNKKIDELAGKVLVEPDTTKRDLMIKEAFEILQKDYGYIPLHQQALAWGVSKKLSLPQRADNQVIFYWATKQE